MRRDRPTPVSAVVSDPDGALAVVNDELARHGLPPVSLTTEQSNRAFQSLQAYAAGAGVSLERAARDTARYRIRQDHLSRRS